MNSTAMAMKDLLLPNTINQKDEKPHTAGLVDTAIYRTLKSKSQKYRLKKSSIPGGALGYFLGGYVPPGTPNWHPVLKKNSPKIDTLF